MAVTLQRLTSLLLLLAVFAYSAEAVLGVLRDGEVHHETFAAAVSHGGQHGGDHGHEDGPMSHPHGPGHQHGTSLDHCTHHHTATVADAFALSFPPATAAELAHEAPHLLDRTLSAPFHPPQA